MTSVSPCLWFDGKAEEAARFYVSLLSDSRIDAIVPYDVETPGGVPGAVMLVEFTLAGRSYLALNGGPTYRFTPAVSFAVSCEDQGEIDRLWSALLEGGSALACGWLTDRYGLSWQITPAQIKDWLRSDDPALRRRVMTALLDMVKIDVAALERAAADV